MTKKKSIEPVKQLAKVIEQKKSSQKNVFRGGNPPEGYRFAPGQSGNPQGRPSHSIYAQVLSDRMMRSCPPRKLCEAMGIDPSVTLGEAIMISLSNAAICGDTSAAKEVLGALGFASTAARNNVLINLPGTGDPQHMKMYERFCHETRWLPEQCFEQLWEVCRELAVPPTAELTADCLPPVELDCLPPAAEEEPDETQ
jgi:hypothetical protein